MTTEQLKELAEALSVLSAKSSVLKERDEMIPLGPRPQVIPFIMLMSLAYSMLTSYPFFPMGKQVSRNWNFYEFTGINVMLLIRQAFNTAAYITWNLLLLTAHQHVASSTQTMSFREYI